MKMLSIFFLIIFSVSNLYPFTNTVVISGIVTNESGEPLDSIRVNIVNDSLNVYYFSYTDNAGYYSISIDRMDTGIDNEIVPDGYQLYQNYPNPFNPGTIISFNLPKSDHVNITIYNVQGQRVKTLTNDIYAVGLSQVHWDGSNEFGKGVSAGVYFY